MDRYKLLITDLDDTLLTSNFEISTLDREMILDLEKKGIKTILCSGRPTASMIKVAKKLFPSFKDNYIISYNGASVTKLEENTPLFSLGLEQDIAKDIANIAHKAGITAQLYRGEKFFVEEETERAIQYSKDTGLEYEIVGDLSAFIDFSPLKMLLHGEHEELLAILPKVEKICKNRAHFTFSKPHYLEFINLNVNKGVGIEKLCEALGIEISKTLAVGDSDNDIEMLQTAGKAVVVANAKERPRKIASYICKNDNNNSAISEVIKKFF